MSEKSPRGQKRGRFVRVAVVEEGAVFGREGPGSDGQGVVEKGQTGELWRAAKQRRPEVEGPRG